MTPAETALYKKVANHHCRVSALVTMIIVTLASFPESALDTLKQRKQLQRCKRWANDLGDEAKKRKVGTTYTVEFSALAALAVDFIHASWPPNILSAQDMGEIFLALSWCVEETIKEHGTAFGTLAQWKYLNQTLTTFWKVLFDGSGSTDLNEIAGCKAGRGLEDIFFA